MVENGRCSKGFYSDDRRLLGMKFASTVIVNFQLNHFTEQFVYNNPYAIFYRKSKLNDGKDGRPRRTKLQLSCRLDGVFLSFHEFHYFFLSLFDFFLAFCAIFFLSMDSKEVEILVLAAF